MKEKDKAQFQRKAADNNGLARINIPQEIAEHLEIQPGDTIELQTEHSEKHGPYASFWNKTQQQSDTQ